MTNQEIAQLISERIGERPVPFEAVRQLALDIYHELGGQEDDRNFEDIFEILLSIIPLTNLINDSSIVLDKTWSSYKINSEIESVKESVTDLLDDTSIASNKTWSSEKIDYEFSIRNILTGGQNINIDSSFAINAEGYIFDSSNGAFATIYRQDENDGGELVSNIATGLGSHAEGYNTTASGDYGSHAEGADTIVTGNWGAHAEGYDTSSCGLSSHAEGFKTNATGDYGSHAEGYKTNALASNTHAEGALTTASGEYGSHAEGYETIASGNYGSHAEGKNTTASGIYGSHAEGNETIAGGASSHAEGHNTTALGFNSHAEGADTSTDGLNSHAEGLGTITLNDDEHAEGKYNLSHIDNASNGKTLHSTGIGSGTNARKNALEVMQNGDMYVINVGDYQGTDTKVQNASIMTVQEVVNGKANTSYVDTNFCKLVICTQALYEALQTKDPSTLYIISDVL